MKELLIGLHILGGGAGLLALPIPLVAKKGGRIHILVGQLFMFGMGLSAASGALLGLLALVGSSSQRPKGAFFILLSMLLANALSTALGALKRKKAPGPAGLLPRLLPVSLMLAGALVGLWGVISAEPLMMIFGALSAGNGYGDLRFAARPLPSRMAWWYQHMSSMMVASISAVTAFAVVGSTRLTGHSLGLWAWLLPSALLVPGFTFWIRRYKRRFGE